MKTRLLAAAATLALTTAVATAAAEAASWQQVTATTGSTIDQVGTYRTSDGILHVTWRFRTGPTTEDIRHTEIGRNGRVGLTTPVVSGWAGVADPAIVPVPGGLRTFWGGIRSIDTTDPNQQLNSAFSADGGMTWGLQEGSVVPGDAQAYASDVSATTLANGTTLQAWSGTLGTWVHAGLDPLTPNTNFQAGLGDYGNQPALASAPDGSAMMTWFSSAEAARGVLAQAVGVTGAPAGPVMAMPGTSVMLGGGTVSRTPIAVRPGSGGYYTAYAVGYPSPTSIRLWRVGAGSTLAISKASGSPQVAVAADANGRLWVAWSDGVFGSKRVRAVRSNRNATRWGAIVDAGAVKGGNSVYSLDADATTGALDALALFGVGTNNENATYVTRILPGLTLKASRRSLGDKPRRVTFTVTDAGDAVKGATVKVSGRSATTGKSGKVTFTLSDKATARASASGYTGASVRLR